MHARLTQHAVAHRDRVRVARREEGRVGRPSRAIEPLDRSEAPIPRPTVKKCRVAVATNGVNVAIELCGAKRVPVVPRLWCVDGVSQVFSSTRVNSIFAHRSASIKGALVHVFALGSYFSTEFV